MLVGGGVVGLAAVSVGAWAAYSFITTGPQPAEALPADTLGYVSIDLDPSGGQKIEALRTLNKFPAFEDEVGIGAEDDIRKEIFDRIQKEAQCEGLDYGDDVEPWLGDRAAVAAVDLGGDAPDAVVVLQVKDGDAADEGLEKIKACSNAEDDDTTVGWTIEGDWAVLAETEDIADDVVAAAKKSSLADDEDFQKWTDEAGDAGVMTLYAGPAAGDYFAEHAEDLGGLFGAATECYAAEAEVPDDSGDDMSDETDDSDPFETEACADGTSDLVPDGLADELREFKGMAATVRFSDGAIELEIAGDNRYAGQFLASGGGTADVVSSLPSDTGAVFGVGFADGWFADMIDQIAPYTGQSADELLDMLSEESGLDLPDDAETLAGDSAALAISSDVDPDVLFSSPDSSDVPVAVKIEGDPDEIEKVLDKLREMAGPDAGALDSDAEGDTIVIGPNGDYRAKVLEDGDLSDNDVFKDVVRESEASTILFVNVDEFEDVIEQATEGDDDVLANIKPISGFGVTSWIDGDTAHAVVRLTTD